MKEWLKRYLCRIDWHSIFVGWDDVKGGDAFQPYVACRWCGAWGWLDSQGNLCVQGKK